MKSRQIILSLLCCSILQSTAFSQFTFEFSDEPIVKVGGNDLINAWAGGLDYIQISDFDFDFDGDLDLFIFDRSQNNIRVFTQELISGNPTWKLAYNAKQKFPNDIVYRATMIDYDFDGRKDLFTYGIGGLRVFRNVGNVTDGLQWELVKPIVESDYNGFTSNLLVASSDIPAIEDIDFDGDFDILTFHQGGQHVEYHKNLSMEMYGIPDSLVFELKNECWGKFAENVNNNSVTLNDPNVPCNSTVIPNPEKSGANHAGSTMLAIDIDNSGVMDLVLGDVAYNNLVLLINGGTEPNQNSAMVSQDIAFPSNSLPANLYLFPAPFLVDVDFDGKKDLIVGANARNVSENETSILYYKNTGTNALPVFNYQTNAFLQNQMIDHGKGSIPVLFDVDSDGKKDLIVSNFFRYKNETEKESTMAWYKNTGTTTNPIYTFIDYDFLDFSQENYGFRLVPTFGDIDNDGLDEMIVGNEFGKLILFENNGTTFVNPIQNYTDNNSVVISVGTYSYPQLFDLNNDGLLDLVIGNKTGEIAYYQNVGTANTPSFQLVTSLLGNIDLSGAEPDAYTAPHFIRKDDTTFLFLGALDGKLHFYDDIDGNLTGGFHLVSNQLLNLDVEAYSSFWVEDIDGDGFLNMFVGQDLGGLNHFEVDPNSTISVPEIQKLEGLVYPNPTSDVLNIQMEVEKNYIAILLYSTMQEIQRIDFKKITKMDLSHLSAGIYFVQIVDQDGNGVMKKIVKY